MELKVKQKIGSSIKILASQYNKRNMLVRNFYDTATFEIFYSSLVLSFHLFDLYNRIH